MKTELTCIGCPMGCTITVETEENKILSVNGNTCNVGDSYARQEVTAPSRIVTTTVRMKGGKYPVIPVKTNKPIPKSLIPDVIQAIKKIDITSPVQIGDVILSNVLDTGSDIVVTGGIQ